MKTMGQGSIAVRNPPPNGGCRFPQAIEHLMQPHASHLAASPLTVPPNDRESFTVLQHLDTPQAQPLRMSSRGLLVVSCESGLICGAGGLQRDAVVYGLALADAAFRASFSRAHHREEGGGELVGGHVLRLGHCHAISRASAGFTLAHDEAAARMRPVSYFTSREKILG